MTTTVVEWANIFDGPQRFDILCASLNFCANKFDCYIIAYCLMPNHLHLVLWPQKAASISDFMRDFKKYTSVKVRMLLEKDGDERSMDVLKRNAFAQKEQVFKLWQSRFDDFALNKRETMITKINYIHDNPVRKGLVSAAEDWQYSSARDYMLGEATPVEVCKDW